jgi:uncharacterized protein
MKIAEQIATELSIKPQQVAATITLLDQGDTVPFIARYRKEATSALDDIQLRKLAERLDYLRQLEQRKNSILSSIQDQGLLTPQLRALIENSSSKTEIEDFYLPFKPKRNSKASVAKEAGLAPLAEQLLSEQSHNPEYIAQSFLNSKQEINTVEQALEGAQQILLEQLAESTILVGQLRHWFSQNAIVQVSVKRGKNDPQSKFRDYFDFQQALNKIPSHRALAIFRGIKEGTLKLNMSVPEHLNTRPTILIEQQLLHKSRRSQDYWLKQLAKHAWLQKLLPLLETDLTKTLKESADQDSIEVFATNLKDLLMAAPAGEHITMGLDPGLRSGVKVAIVSTTGDFLDQAVIYPHAPQKKWDEALDTLQRLITKHQITLISIGNGTASRETELLAKELQTLATQSFAVVVTSEAGASVYSASELASKEFPDIDVSIRGAISIARRLQDPLAELVKIDPKAIGVGQYQHDVNQKALNSKLSAVVEDCVNIVGVNLNSASAQLLAQVAGINQTIAQNIVQTRENNGEFKSRSALLKVPRLGAKSYQQCAGFLRLPNSKQPLDNSAVHPESYKLVEKMAAQVKLNSAQLISNQTLLSQLDVQKLCDEHYGHYTVTDIIAELAKPGRDPRPEFKTASFDDSINSMTDLQPNMRLEGVVTNVTNFGAFVDIGVHQDGLVHISQLADQFVKDPHQVVSTGKIVKVTVMEVDVARKRISLSMKSNP